MNTPFSSYAGDYPKKRNMRYPSLTILVVWFLISLGAELSNYDYQGTYYAVHNNELEGLQFAVNNGVDIK